MKRIAGLLLACVVLLPAAQAYSQASLYLGGYAGFSMQKPNFENVQFESDTTLVYGLRGGLRILMLAVELTYFRASHNIAMKDFALFNWDGMVNDYSYLGASVRWIFSLLVLHPYLTVGYGYYTADIRTIDKAHDGGFNFGAGLEVSLGKRISLLAEGKYHHVTVDISKINLGLGNFTLCAGLNLNF